MSNSPLTHNIALREVTIDNLNDVVDLPLLAHQKDYLASNTYSIAQSKFDPHYQPRAIYCDEVVVGFLMYHTQDCGVPHQVGIHRFMVDHRQQGKGIGRRALELTLHEIRQIPQVQRITIYYVPENQSAQQFYASFGFQETGIDEDGEMIAVIELARQEK